VSLPLVESFSGATEIRLVSTSHNNADKIIGQSSQERG
jgi:hypothetical protein